MTVPEVISTMLEKRRLATLRNYPYKKGRNVIISYPRGLEVRRVKALVEDVIENPSLEVLEEYLDISGFDDPYTWWLTAKALHGSDPKFLVVLRLL